MKIGIFSNNWGNYGMITNISTHPRAYRIALLLHTTGDGGLPVYNGFTFDTPKEERTTDEIIAPFDTFAVGEINITYERIVFNKIVKQEDETFECFLANIRRLVKTCKYCENCVTSIVRYQIVLGVRDPDTQAVSPKERNLTL